MNAKQFVFALIVTIATTGTSWVKLIGSPSRGGGSSWSSGSSGGGSYGGGYGGGGGGHK
jgi:hypothetical protein